MIGRQAAASPYSERCCGIPASKARTSVSRYRRWPPRVLMDVNFPAFAQRVTVFGSTRNIVATSAGVSSGSASGVRADIMTASPPGPCLAILRPLCWFGSIRNLPWMSHMVHCYHIAITSGDNATTRSRRLDVSPLPPLIWVTLRDPTDTHRRNGRIRKSHVRLLPSTWRSCSYWPRSVKLDPRGLFTDVRAGWDCASTAWSPTHLLVCGRTRTVTSTMKTRGRRACRLATPRCGRTHWLLQLSVVPG